jgi:acetylornithine deacetylase/succinyl-diaminopimelate desuccinylase-like protein
VTPSHDHLVAGLSELIAIPSVSADPSHGADVRRAAQWVVDRIGVAGGQAEVADWHGSPLVIGEVRASREPESAPTILVYAHFDVQPPDPLEHWVSPPFELTERDGWLYARGVADDKAHLFMLLEACESLARAGKLPVNVRFACDGEEETGGDSIVQWLEQDERGADAAIVLDGMMLRRDVPAVEIGLRGVCYFHVTVRTGERDLHSGMYGGVALNALHALNRALAGVMAGPNGLLPEPLRVGITPPTAAELASWAQLPDGAEEVDGQGAKPMDPAAIDQFYIRTWAEPAVDVNGIEGGSPRLQKTVIPVEACANVSMRLAPGQSSSVLVPEFERLVREAAPAGAEIEVALWTKGEPALVAPDSPAIRITQDVFEEAVGVRPLLIRSGGSIPIVTTLTGRGIPAIVTGFSLSESNIHSPNERIPASYLDLGARTVRELLLRLAELG